MKQHWLRDTQVIEKLDFPLFKKDWLAIEEVLLLDAIASYGLGNWEAAVSHNQMRERKRENRTGHHTHREWHN